MKQKKVIIRAKDAGVFCLNPYCIGRYSLIILQDDLTIKPCYIAKIDGYCAHGETLRDAYNDATSKALSNKPVEDRISEFLAYCNGKDKLLAKELFAWHGVLTGSCKLGRAEFCRSHNIDLQRDSFTLAEFISLTKDSYGGEIIRQIKIG